MLHIPERVCSGLVTRRCGADGPAVGVSEHRRQRQQAEPGPGGRSFQTAYLRRDDAGSPRGSVVDAIANGQRPAGMTPDVETAYNFIAELLKTRQVSDPVFLAAKNRFGDGRFYRTKGAGENAYSTCQSCRVGLWPAPLGRQTRMYD